jgi:hypothetical protein
MLDHLIQQMQIGGDAELANVLGVQQGLLRQIRRRQQRVGAELLIRINDMTGIEIRELRIVMGDRRKRTRLSRVDGIQRASPNVKTTWDKLARMRRTKTTPL